MSLLSPGISGDPNTIKILLQIRGGNLATTFQDSHRYFEKNVLPFASQFFPCALEIEKQLQVNNASTAGRPIIWYLMTDSPLVKEYAKQHYGDKVYGELRFLI